MSAVRWENLFADLEAQFERMESAELDSELADRTRREVAQLRLIDRLRPMVGNRITVHALGGGLIGGRIVGIGVDWLLIAEDNRQEVLFPLSAITGITGLSGWSAAPGREGQVAKRLTLGYALRGVARDRATVAICFVDGSIVTGTIDRVGADFFEMAEHPPDAIRRRSEVINYRTVAFGGVSFVRRI